MACHICGRHSVFHGSEIAPAGTYTSEAGCHDGVWMDDDEHAEGWHANVVYRPCPNSPKRCQTCAGSGDAPPGHKGSDDCPTCRGTGWKDDHPEWPTVDETPHAEQDPADAPR